MTLATSIRETKAGLATAIALAAMVGMAAPATAQTLERIQTAGKIVLGYEADAAPFAFTDADGNVAGYAARLCSIVAEQIGGQLGLPDVAMEWVPVDEAGRLAAVQSGQVDLVCGAVPVTLASRAEVSFSLPIFPGGTGALVSTGTPDALIALLSDRDAATRPIWRAAPARTFIDRKTFAVVEGSPAATWLEGRIATFNMSSEVAAVDNSRDGVAQVIDGSADVFFGDLAAVLAAANDPAAGGNLMVIPRYFSHEPAAFAMSRGDEDFRLAVDSALSQAYRSDAFDAAFVEYFGEPAEILTMFFDLTALPD
jgi:polar amino acid transport system substrate-binding protein